MCLGGRFDEGSDSTSTWAVAWTRSSCARFPACARQSSGTRRSMASPRRATPLLFCQMSGDERRDDVRAVAREEVALVIQLEQLRIPQQACQMAADGKRTEPIASTPDQESGGCEVKQI